MGGVQWDREERGKELLGWDRACIRLAQGHRPHSLWLKPGCGQKPEHRLPTVTFPRQQEGGQRAEASATRLSSPSASVRLFERSH